MNGYSAEGELMWAAAEHVEMAADGLIYTFWLRPDGKWSNGEAVTAADFVYSFQRLVDPATAAFYAQQSLGDVVNPIEIIAGERPVSALAVEALDDLRLQIILDHALPYFLRLLTHPSTFPAHRASVEMYGNACARAGHPVANGAGKLQEWKVGS